MDYLLIQSVNQIIGSSALKFAHCCQHVNNSPPDLPTDSYWFQTSSNEVASSHLFPPLDGPGLAQLSDRGCKVIRSCENRVIWSENQRNRACALHSSGVLCVGFDTPWDSRIS